MVFDFFCENKLMKLNPELYKIYIDSLFAAAEFMYKYKSIFPEYKKYCFLHNINVTSNCNSLIGDNIGSMNCGEIYVLLMSALLHDSGIGISENDLHEFCSDIKIKKYLLENNGADIRTIIRDMHHELSGLFIKKYSREMKIPDEFVFPIIQCARGHRLIDLSDKDEYPCTYITGGYKIHLPYIAAVVRLADILDIESECDIVITNGMSDRYVLRCGKLNDLIEDMMLTERKCIILIKKYITENDIADEFSDWIIKLRSVINYTFGIVGRRTPFDMKKRSVTVEYV